MPSLRAHLRPRHPSIAAIVIAVAGLALPVAAADAAKKRKPTRVKVVTRTATVPLASAASAGQATARARCPRRFHATGGGLAVASRAPSRTAAGGKTFNQVSQPWGGRAWSATASQFPATTPSPATSLTTFVRCRRNAHGRIGARLSGSTTIAAGSGQNMVFNCPRGTRPIGGGYAVDRPWRIGDATSSRLFILGSRRTAPRRWVVTAANPTGAPASTVSGFVLCELARGGPLRVRTASAPLPEDGRAAASARCGRRQHVVSGGFAVTPSTFPGSLTPAFIDFSAPLGARRWAVEAADMTPFATPAGAALTTHAYCKPNRLPRRKRRR